MIIFNYSKSQIKPQYLKFISILCACLLPLLVSGPFLPDLIISSLSIWFLYYSLRNKIYDVYYNPFFLIFFLFCLVCIFSSILSDNITLSLSGSLFYFRFGIFSLLIGYLINQNKKILDYFYLSFLITFSLLIVDGFIQYFIGSNLFGLPKGGDRISSFFGSEYVMGSYLVRLYPLFAALYISKSNKNLWEGYFFSVLSILIAVLIYMAGERASIFFLILSSLFFLFFISQYKLARIIIIIISFLLIFLLMIKNTAMKNRYIDSTIQGMGIHNSESYLFTPQHDSLIKTAWNMFLDRPILGHGPKLYRVKCVDPKYAVGITPCHPHPHNFYIQLLAETGVFGFLFLAGLFFYFCYIMTRHTLEYFIYKRKLLSDYKIFLLGGLLITIWPITTNGNIFTNYLMMFYSLQMGFFLKK